MKEDIINEMISKAEERLKSAKFFCNQNNMLIRFHGHIMLY